MAQVIEEARLIMADITNNNNKFWEGKVLDDDTVQCRWGRVGDEGQTGEWQGGVAFLNKKVREKEAKGYKRQSVISDVPVRNTNAPKPINNKTELSRIATSQVETGGNALVNQLLKRLAEANVHSILSATTLTYDTTKGTFSTPLGIVTADAINEARQLLVDIGNFVSNADYNNNIFSRKINEFLTLVPQNIGRIRTTPQGLFPNMTVVQEKNDLLDALEASLQNVLSTTKSPSDNHDSKVFDLKLFLVEDTATINRIKAKYAATRHRQHTSSNFEVKRIYAVEMPSMLSAYQKGGLPLGNIQEYWHGTRIHNVLSILKTGLKCAPPSTAAIAGKMFGNGIYFSDQSTKSLNYAVGSAPGQSGGWDGGSTFMFLADVAMGNTYNALSNSENFPKRGYDSTSAYGGKCKSSWGGTLMNNEFIVYKDNQFNITFLVEFTKDGR